MDEKIMRIARGWSAARHHREWPGDEEMRFYDIIARLGIGNKIVVFKGSTGSEYSVPVKRIPYLATSARKDAIVAVRP